MYVYINVNISYKYMYKTLRRLYCNRRWRNSVLGSAATACVIDKPYNKHKKFLQFSKAYTKPKLTTVYYDVNNINNNYLKYYSYKNILIQFCCA